MAYCDEYLELINSSIDGALFPAEQARLEDHLAQCPDCKALYSDLRRVHLTLQSLPNLAAPEGLTDRVMAAVRSDNVTPLPVKKSGLQWRRWAATAAVLALILAGAGGLRLLTGRDVVAPTTGESATPESADPALTRSLPPPAQDSVLPTEDVRPETGEDEVPTTQESTPAPTPEPVPTPEAKQEIAPISVPTTPPTEVPQESQETPSNYMVAPFTTVPVMTLPTEGAEDDSPQIGVQGVSLQPEMTEGALAAMQQVRFSLAVGEDYVWEDDANRWTDNGIQFLLVYTGFGPGERYYCFDLWSTPLYTEDAQTVLHASYAVPVDGGEVLLRSEMETEPELEAEPEAEPEAEVHDHHG